MIFNAYEESKRFYKVKSDKKRIDIYNKQGERLLRFYDYGDAEYLGACYAEIFTPKKFTIKIYNIK